MIANVVLFVYDDVSAAAAVHIPVVCVYVISGAHCRAIAIASPTIDVAIVNYHYGYIYYICVAIATLQKRKCGSDSTIKTSASTRFLFSLELNDRRTTTFCQGKFKKKPPTNQRTKNKFEKNK